MDGFKKDVCHPVFGDKIKLKNVKGLFFNYSGVSNSGE